MESRTLRGLFSSLWRSAWLPLTCLAFGFATVTMLFQNRVARFYLGIKVVICLEGGRFNSSLPAGWPARHARPKVPSRCHRSPRAEATRCRAMPAQHGRCRPNSSTGLGDVGGKFQFYLDPSSK